jgi:hypothetical protein
MTRIISDLSALFYVIFGVIAIYTIIIAPLYIFITISNFIEKFVNNKKRKSLH